MTYIPPAQVLALAATLALSGATKGSADEAHPIPIAHAIKPNGDVVIVFEDGRKLTFKPLALSGARAERSAAETKRQSADEAPLKDVIGEIPPPNVIASRSPDPERSEGEGAAKKQSPRKKG